MEVFIEPRGSAKRLWKGFVPSVTAFWSAFVLAVLFVAPAAATGTRPHKIDLSLTVHDVNGNSIPKFEAMLHTYEEGYIRWQSGQDGKIHFGAADTDSLRIREDPHFHVILRAPGLAPAILNLEDTGAYMERTVSLTPGRLIELSVQTADGRPIPQHVIPLVVFTDYAQRVRAMRQPENITPGHVFDYEMSKVHCVDKGRYQFRVPAKTPPFFLAIHEPGFMRSVETKVIEDGDLAGGRIQWVLPEPARLSVHFDLPESAGPLEYDYASAQLVWQIPGTSGGGITVWLQKYGSLSFDTTLDDLPPNHYWLTLRLVPPKQAGVNGRGSTIRLYWDRLEFDLTAGEQKTINFTYAPFDPNGWRGNATAMVTVKKYGGEPAVGDSYTLSYVVPHYDTVVVKEGKLDAKGRFQLDGACSGPNGPQFYLKVGDEWLGMMQMSERASQHFEFTLAPRAQDRAPDVTFTDLNTAKPVSLRALQGHVVYLEFWATWCGPCQIPMAHLNEVTKRRRSDWDGRVHVLAASIDDSKDVVGPYVKQRGWTYVRHLWTGQSDCTGFKSPAAEKFGITGVPTAILIDPQGLIVWRGHPSSKNCETQIDELL